jgi:aerotaxis receptor
MKINLPVTQQEYDYPGREMLVSTTDTRGYITHCNHAFVAVSGYTADELTGQNHNMVRHPDMPPEAFKDLWTTVGRGKPWTGLVKNRRKDGDHYWVVANVTPIMEGRKPVAYMSVRTKPTREQIRSAEALYARMNREREAGRRTVAVVGGHVRRLGWRGWLQAHQRLDSTHHLALALLLMIVVGMLPQAMEFDNAWQELAAHTIALMVGAAGILAWFRQKLARAVEEANRFAGDMASCNLTTEIENRYPEPLRSLIRNLQQVQVNLRAVIGDVRAEVEGFSQSAREIAAGSIDLSARTESQASSLEQTAASMEELASTVRQTADNANLVAEQTTRSSATAVQGQQAIRSVSESMGAIEQSSRKVSEIITVIESIAFQTNILALNAAVEAARAGEQGRGFAVVASEVRGLAQRSANAAKEIRDLIGASVDEVARGARQMHEASSIVDDVASEVRKVTDLVSEIRAATQEQSQGISQVNEAVVQLDNVTQQNAALVEESTAAAENLNQGTETLQKAVAIFRLQ